MYGVIGNPISHSLSPKIHQNFAQQTNISLVYKTFLAPKPDEQAKGFEQVCNTLFGSGVNGLNVTVPFKELAFQLANSLDEYATLAKAVNTLKKMPRRDGSYELIGYNTDGLGLLNDLKQKEVWFSSPINDRNDNDLSSTTEFNILFLGIGGACRGAVATIILEYLKEYAKTETEMVEKTTSALKIPKLNISFWNRTADKVPFFIGEFQDYLNQKNCSSIQLSHFDTEKLDFLKTDAKTSYNLVINTTSIALSEDSNKNKNNNLTTLNILKESIPCHQNTFWYDMSYRKKGEEETPFLTIPISKNQRFSDGFGMLIEQAAQSFKIWHGLRHQINTRITMEDLC